MIDPNQKISLRNPYFDFLRGIAILMVVGIHTYPGNHNLHGEIFDVIQLCLINFFNCAVPLFLAVSGFFIGKKMFVSFPDYNQFWRRQIPKVYIPCLIFSLPWLIISCISINTRGGIIINLINYFFCGYSIYYFIALIIQCYLLAPILVRHNNVKTLLGVVLISLISTLALEYIRFHNAMEIPLIIRGSFPPLLIFFYIGIFLNKHSRDYSLFIPFLMIVAGFCLGIIQMQFIRETYGMSAQGQKITLYLFDAGIILLAMSRKSENAYKNNVFTRIILWIGELSFGIYFTHIYVIWIAERFFTNINDSWILFWFLSLVITLLFITIVKKISPEYAKQYLGYR